MSRSYYDPRTPTEEEEAEYYYQNNPHHVRPMARVQYGINAGPENPRRGMNPNQYGSPIGPQRESAAAKAARFGRGVREAGQAVSDAGRAAMENTGIQPMTAGVREYAGRMGTGAQERSPGSRQQYPVPAAVDQTSVIHPGNKLYVIEGSILAAGGGVKKPRPPQQRGPKPGFGNDPGF
jgi:hypothetical protein